MEPVYRPVIGVARCLFFAQGLRFEMSGEEHVPRHGGAVMAINHTSYMDFTYAGLAARKSGRFVRFMAKESIFTNRVSGPLMRGMKHIPVDRSAGAASFRAAIAALKAGEIVGVFPEATISMSFELKDFKSGTVRMAQVAGVPILPVTMWGGQRTWTKGQPKHMGRTNVPILIEVGEPMTVTKRDNADAATVELRRRMTELLHAQQDRYPPLTGPDLVYLPARLGGTAPTPEEAAAQEAAKAAKVAGPPDGLAG